MGQAAQAIVSYISTHQHSYLDSAGTGVPERVLRCAPSRRLLSRESHAQRTLRIGVHDLRARLPSPGSSLATTLTRPRRSASW